MPNTVPAITTGAKAREYGEAVRRHLDADVLTTIKLTSDTAPTTIREAHGLGVAAAKLYPEGATTNSEGGVPPEWLDNPPQQLADVLGEMERCGMVLCCHGEVPDRPTFGTYTKIEAFLESLAGILSQYPRLRATVEHISSEEEVEFVTARENVAATITPHHLTMTVDDLLGGRLRPHNFCKPVLRTAADRDAIVAAVTHERFFLGTDSAPHPRIDKECSECCAGIFNAESAIQVVAQALAPSALEAFTSTRGDAWYGRPPTGKRIRLVREPNVVTASTIYRPWRLGEVLEWRYAGRVT